MESEFERFMIRSAHKFHEKIKLYDRGVVWGCLLSITPIFPACFFGLLLSLANVIFGITGRLNRRNTEVAVVSSLAGATFSLLWLYFFISVDIRVMADYLTSFFIEAVNFIFGTSSKSQPLQDSYV